MASPVPIKSTLSKHTDGHKIVLPLGTTFSIHCIDKKQGRSKEVPLTFSPVENVYYALFDEDDVDFEVVVDNTGSKDRDVRYYLELHKESHRFMVDRGCRSALQTLETRGRKFHFIKQSSQDGQSLVAIFARQHDVTYEEASEIVSQMKFRVDYSEAAFQVNVKSLTGKKLTMKLNKFDSIETLKYKILMTEGYPVKQQNIMFNGKRLENHVKVQDYGIGDGSTLYLTFDLRGGGVIRRMSPYFKKRESERGVICFGENSSQHFKSVNFTADHSICAEPFVIEMRLVPPNLKLSSA